MPRRKAKTYILCTIPAIWITKESPVSDFVRKALDDCLGECYGRCYWRFDDEVLCTSEQFGELVARLMEKEELDIRKLNGRSSRYIKITKAVTEDYTSE